MSGAMAAAIRNISSGNAPYQKRRERRNRAIVGGIQAALMGAAGAISATQAADEARKAADARQMAEDVDYIRGYHDKPKSVSQIASEALAKMDNGKLATEVSTSGDKWNPSGSEAAMGDADELGDDILTAKRLMRSGSSGINPVGSGLGGSLRSR